MDRRLNERLISSRKVFEGRLIALSVDEVESADGRRGTREVVAHPGAVAIVPLLAGDRVVMIRHYRHAAGRVLWELPAGVLENDEEPEECARRELVEEIGYTAGKLLPLFSVFLSPGFSTELMHLFLAQDLRKVEAVPEADERVEIAEVSLAEAEAMVYRGEVQNAAAVCGLLAVAARRRT